LRWDTCGTGIATRRRIADRLLCLYGGHSDTTLRRLHISWIGGSGEQHRTRCEAFRAPLQPDRGGRAATARCQPDGVIPGQFPGGQAPLPPLVLPGLEITPPEWVDTDTSKFDLSMELVANGGAGGFIEYRTDLFDEATIARLADDYFELLVGLLAEQDCPLQDVKAVQRLRQRYRRFKPLIPRMNLRGSVPEPAYDVMEACNE